MRTFKKDERFPSRAARDRGIAEPLLTIDEQLNGVSLELTRPIKVNDKEISEISINAPTPDDILDFEERDDTKDAQLQAISKVTSISADNLRKLHVRDFSRLRELYWGFTV